MVLCHCHYPWMLVVSPFIRPPPSPSFHKAGSGGNRRQTGQSQSRALPSPRSCTFHIVTGPPSGPRTLSLPSPAAASQACCRTCAQRRRRRTPPTWTASATAKRARWCSKVSSAKGSDLSRVSADEILCNASDGCAHLHCRRGLWPGPPPVHIHRGHSGESGFGAA